jgi:inosose dehydratase
VTIALANAPVSYGVFELTVDTDRFLPTADRVLGELVSAGYAGVDLGPLAYLGDEQTLPTRLAECRIGLAGGYIEMPFHDPDALANASPYLERVLDVFAAVAAGGQKFPSPRPTLAAAGDEAHRARPGQAHNDRSIGLDDAAWLVFADGLKRVVERCRERGFEPAFHPHAATAVEAPWEIDRLLATSDVGLCFDTGHLIVGGGDPVECLPRWAERINQVHLKDARLSLLAEIQRDGGSATEIWTRAVFCPLGLGDLDVAGVVDQLRKIGYDGWAVVEQDVLTANEPGFEHAVADQRANRDVLRSLGL